MTATLAPSAVRHPVPTGRAPLLRLLWMLGRPGVQSTATIVLPVVAFAVTTALLLTVVGGALMFWGWTSELAGLYQMLSVIALALLVVPLASLGGSAARLSARRRDDRLATLRLLGATPATVVVMTVIESTVLAVAGAVAGVALYAAAMPLVGLIPFDGGPIGPTAVWVGLPVLLLVIAGVAVIAAVSSAVGLRRVAITPLGVRTRQQAPRMHWARALVGVAVIGIAFVAVSTLNGSAAFGIAVLVLIIGGSFAAAVGILNLIGPWAVGVLARVQLKGARSAQRLIAARGILENPKAAWRQVSGIAMTSFVAVVAGSGMAYADVASAAAAEADRILIEDVRTGILITLVASFVMVACSVGVGQASELLDRRDLWVSLDRLGMPRSVMEAARTRTVMAPLLFVMIASAVVGGLLVFPLLGLAMVFAPLSVLVIVGCFVLGVALVVAALVATRPVLGAVLSAPERA